MNQYHTQKQLLGIEASLKAKDNRVLSSFSATFQQLDLVSRILAVRRKVSEISSQAAIMVFGASLDTACLFRFTDLYKKDVIGILDDGEVTSFYDNYHGMKRYEIYPCRAEIINKADCIIIASFIWKEKIIEDLEKLGYEGQVVSIYDKEDELPFYCIYENEENCSSNQLYLKANLKTYHMANECYFDMIGRIDKINKKLELYRGKRILVYGAGRHTEFLMKYTDIKYYDVVAIVDRNVRDFYGIKVREPIEESFNDCEYIVVSSFKFQQDMSCMLQKLGQKNKLILLYDEEDKAEFYENYNIFSPDFVYKRSYDKKYALEDVQMQVEELLNRMTRNSDYYLTYQMKDDAITLPSFEYENEAEVNRLKNYPSANCKIAIIIQGPVIYEDDFTFKSICMYRRMFLDATVILSTWEGENVKDEFQKFKSLDIEIVFSKPPSDGGSLNINYQVKSSREGVKRAKELGIPYCVKTRTDFRIYARGILKLIYTLLQKYPLREVKGMRQRERLVILPPYLDVAYYIPDYIIAGNTDDMLQFWSIPEAVQEGEIMNPEMRLYSSYLYRIGQYVHDPMKNLETYLNLLSNQFIVIDPDMYDAIWRKYTYEKYERSEWSKNRFTFADWLAGQGKEDETER